MTNKSKLLADGTRVEPTVADSLHTAVGGLLTTAEEASNQKTESFTPEQQSKQDRWVNFLKNTVLGPRDIRDPEGTLQHTPTNTVDYFRAFGQTSPNINTAENKKVVSDLFDGSLKEVGDHSIDPQDALYQPQLTTGDVVPVIPEDLVNAKQLLMKYVCQVHQHAKQWFNYMFGDKSALPTKRQTDSSSTDSYDRSDWCQDVAEFENIDGIGPVIVENIRSHFAAGDSSVTLSSEVINKQVNIADQYDNHADYLDSHTPMEAAELKANQPEVWAALKGDT